MIVLPNPAGAFCANHCRTAKSPQAEIEGAPERMLCTSGAWGRLVAACWLLTSFTALMGVAQSQRMSGYVQAPAQSSTVPRPDPQSADSTGGAMSIPLTEAIARARSNEPNFAAAVAAGSVANMDKAIARASLLPSAIYHNQYLYTQPQLIQPITGFSGANVTPRFIANNATHEYTSQAVVSETIGLQQVASLKQTSALAEAAAAQLEIARRGLVAAVIVLYYNVSITQNKLSIAKQSLAEAKNFTQLTEEREAAREAAHADVLKATLQVEQRERDLSDAKLAADKAKLELGVLLFPDPRTDYRVLDGVTLSAPDPMDALQAATNHDNPELASAAANLRAADFDLAGARAAYLPDLSLNYYYGIDAAQFAINGPDGTRNLGYAAMVTIDIPVWDWFTTHDRVRQKASLRNSAKVALSAAKRRVVADFDEVYSEAKAAADQLSSYDASVATARESLRLTRLRYTAGEASVLDVVDAESSYTAVQLAREDGFLRYQTALANLQVLTGKF